MTKVGRNDPCTCGSGKKYKKCCLARDEAKPPATYHDHCLEVVDSLRQKILKFADKPRISRFHDDAFGEYWQTLEEGLEPPDPSDGDILSFMDWFIHDYRLPDRNKPPIRLYLESDPRLPDEERRVIEDWQDAYISVYRIKEVKPGQGALVEDIFTQTERFVSDYVLSERGQPGGLLIVRLVKVFDEWQGTAAGVGLPPDDGEAIRQFILDRHEAYRADHPDAGLPEFLRWHGHLIKHFVLTRMARPHQSGETAAPDSAEEARKDFQEQHYQKWPDTPLPSLGGRTPRETLQTPEGRDRVESLIRSLETRQAGLEPMPAYDFGRLRKALGL